MAIGGLNGLIAGGDGEFSCRGFACNGVCDVERTEAKKLAFVGRFL